MLIEKRSVKEIKFNSYNPNRIPEDKFKSLVENIKRFGFLQPVLIDSNNVVIDGEHRVKACIEAGITEIQCVIFESDETVEEYKKLLTLSMNNLRGMNIPEKFEDVIKDISLKINMDDINLLTGFDENEIKKYIVDCKDIQLIQENIKPYNKIHILISCNIDQIQKINNFIKTIPEDFEIEKGFN